MRDAALRLLADLALNRPKTVVTVGVLLAAISAVLAITGLRMNANTDDLISPDRPYMQKYRAFIDEFGDLEGIHAVVTVPEGMEAEARAAADELAARLRSHPELPRALHRIEPDEQLRLAAWNMSAEELEGTRLAGPTIGMIRAGVDAESLAQDALQRGAALKRPGLPSVKKREAASIVFAAEAISSVVEDSAGAEHFGGFLDLEPEYLASDTGRLLFLEMMPAKDYSTLAVIEEPLRMIREEIAAVQAAHPEVEIGLTGKPVLQADEMATSDADMLRSSLIAVVLVALLFMAMMGGVTRPGLAVVTLGLAIGWTFGFTTLAIGQLNLLSIVFTLVLVGVGIDFGVHVIARYQEELREKERRQALRDALLHAGKGNISGAITSSTAFLMALLTDFRGLQELGLIGGCGILFCLIGMSSVLPALLTLFDAKARPMRVLRARVMDRPARVLRHHPGQLLAGLAIVTVLLGFAAKFPGFDGNVLELQAVGLDSVEWEHRILEDSSAASWFGAMIADDLEGVAERVEKAKASEDVGSVLSVLDFMPLPDERRFEQAAALAEAVAPPELIPGPARPLSFESAKGLVDLLREMARLAEGRAEPDEVAYLGGVARDMARVAKTLETEGPVAASLREKIEARLDELKFAFDAIGEGAAMEMRELMPEAVRHRLVAPSGRFLVSAHPRENVWALDPMERFVGVLREIDPEITGVPITHMESIHDMRAGFGKAALYSLLAVLLIVIIDFKSLGAMLLSVTPLAVAATWLLLAMGLAELSFNLANFFSVPILIGIGVDNGIHLVHRFREGGPNRLKFSSTHRGVILTSATSFIGFGCLGFATHRGLQSLGSVMALGCAVCLVSSLLVLPAILALIDRRSAGSA